MIGSGAIWHASRRSLRVRPQAASDWIGFLQLALLLVPYTWLALFAALVIRARVRLGFWPYAHYIESGRGVFEGGWHPSPLDPNEFPMHNLATWLVAGAVLLSIFVYAPLAAAPWQRRVAPVRLFNTLYVLGLAAFFAVWNLDPGGFVDWLMDWRRSSREELQRRA